MKLFFSYLKYHRKSIVLFIILSVIFSIVIYLYDLPLKPVIYAVILCLSFSIIISLVSFYNFSEKHKALVRLKKTITVSDDELEIPSNIIEKDYCELINILEYEKSRIQLEKDNTISEMKDYYTLWAHQIKTPISAMQLLIETGETNIDELSEQLFKIEEYAQMVLTYLRADFDCNDYLLKSYSLDNIVRDSVKKYAKSFIRKKIILDYKQTDLCIVTDEKWLSFVIGQLLSNALKYTRKGKISIYKENDNTLVIEDTGIGIAPEDLPRVCEKGYTGYNGREDRKSTGIGLYLCKRVLDNLSCSLKIESEIGKGTKVKILFNTCERVYE